MDSGTESHEDTTELKLAVKDAVNTGAKYRNEARRFALLLIMVVPAATMAVGAKMGAVKATVVATATGVSTFGLGVGWMSTCGNSCIDLLKKK